MKYMPLAYPVNVGRWRPQSRQLPWTLPIKISNCHAESRPEGTVETRHAYLVRNTASGADTSL